MCRRHQHFVGYCADVNTLLGSVQTSSTLCWLLCRRHQHFVGYCADVVNTLLVTVQTSKAIVFIEERTEVADVTFPTKPIVLSLRDYDRAEDADQNPVQGYPLVCITVSLRNTYSVLF